MFWQKKKKLNLNKTEEVVAFLAVMQALLTLREINVFPPTLNMTALCTFAATSVEAMQEKTCDDYHDFFNLGKSFVAASSN